MHVEALAEVVRSSRFAIRARVGEGAVGVVYEAFDNERNTRVAIKTLRSPSAETIHLLKKEFRALQDLQHPNLVSLGELFEEDGRWFFTMEFVQGKTFMQHVRPGGRASRSSLLPMASGTMPRADPGRLDEGRLRAALAQLARGLAALHEAGKVHRDVKPSNVLVTPEERVVLLDFGLVADAARDRKRDDALEGTVPYMAPEQAASESVGFAADWYAVGVMLFQALTGRLPFHGMAGEILEDKLTREAPAPHDVSADVPADLDALCAQLLRMDPRQRPTDAQILERLNVERDAYESASHRAAVFVGRDAEQEALRAAFRDVERGGAVTVFVHGESGVGKSFLVRRFTERLTRERPRVLVLSGRCYERESVAYKAVDGVVDALSEYLRELRDGEVKALLPPHVGPVAKAFPVLGQVPAIAEAIQNEAVVASPTQLRTYTFEALRRLLDALARRQPLVITIDDLQWADHDSLVLLSEITRPPAPPPLLLVATLRLATESRRPAGPAPLPGPRIGGDLRHVHLEHLSSEEAEHLVASLLERVPDGDGLRASIGSIVADTKGHPLFIDEIVRQASARPGESGGPLRLDDALWNRIERLEPDARRVLEVVAMAGLPLAQSVTAQAAAMPFGDVFRVVSTLRAERLVRTSGAGKKDFIEPYHDRVREVVTARLDAESRRDWHKRLAVALEGWTDAAETLANHWEGAGRPDRARQYAIAAAERAEQALAFDRAVRLYRRALELCDDGEARTVLRGQLAEALTNAGCWAEAADVRLDLASRADRSTALDLRRRAAEQLMCSGHFDRGVSALRDALAACRVGDPTSRVALLVALVVYRLLLALRGLAYTERRPTEGERAQLVRADTARSAGAGFAMTDNIRGAYFQTRCLLMALRAGDRHRIAHALCMEVCFSSAGGIAKRARTRRLLASARALCDRVGTGEALGLAAAAAGYSHYFVGEWTQAAEWLARAEEYFRDRCVGVTFELNSVRMMLYRTLSQLGRVRDLAARVPAVHREAEEHGDLYTSISLRAGPLTLMGLVDDEPGRVRDDLLEATEWLPKTRFLVQHYWFMLGRTQVDLYEGDAIAAHRLLEDTWGPLARSLLLHVEAVRIAALEQRGRCALAAAATGRAPKAMAIAERQARALQRSQFGWARGSADLLLAGIEAVRGREDSARRHLEGAVRTFEEAAMSLYAAAARRRLGQLRAADGRELVAVADAWMTAQGVREPARLTRVIAPGFPD